MEVGGVVGSEEVGGVLGSEVEEEVEGVAAGAGACEARKACKRASSFSFLAICMSWRAM